MSRPGGVPVEPVLKGDNDTWGCLSDDGLTQVLECLPVMAYNTEKTGDPDQWVELMFACHYATAAAGLQVFADWCATDPNYQKPAHLRSVESRWNSLKGPDPTRPAKRTAHTLRLHLQQHGTTLAWFDKLLGRGLEGRFEVLQGEAKYKHYMDRAREVDSDIDELIGDLATDDALSAAKKAKVFKAAATAHDIPAGAIKSDYRDQLKLNTELEKERPGESVQLNVARWIVADYGGVGQFMYIDGLFWWFREKTWEPLQAFKIKQAVMLKIEENGIKVTVSLTNSVLETVQTIVAQDNRIWDRPEGDAPRWACDDMEVTFDTDGTWQTWGHLPQSYLRGTLPIRWDSKQSHEAPLQFQAFLNKTFKDYDTEEKTLLFNKLAVLIAYSLCDTEPWLETCAYLYGPAASGKSTLLKVVKAMSGDHHSALDLRQIGHRFTCERLIGKLVNISGEATDRGLDDGRFKGLVSGEPMEVDGKHRGYFTMSNRAVFWFAGNRMPVSEDCSTGVLRRISLFQLKHTIPANEYDTGLADRLIRETDAIFAWAMEVFKENYLKDRCVNLIARNLSETEAFKQDLLLDTNTVLAWFDECCTRSTGVTIKQKAYDSYTNFLELNHIPLKAHLSKRKFGMELKIMGMLEARELTTAGNGGARAWKGFTLLDGF